jgi:HlyD family secretion protein
VAALHPTLFSPAQGIVALTVKAGTVVKKGQDLAHVESPELLSRFNQERSSLQALQGDLGRQEIATCQAALRAGRTSSADHAAQRCAPRARARPAALQGGLLNSVDYERSETTSRRPSWS